MAVSSIVTMTVNFGPVIVLEWGQLRTRVTHVDFSLKIILVYRLCASDWGRQGAWLLINMSIYTIRSRRG